MNLHFLTNIIIIQLFLLLSINIQAQDPDQCRKIVDLTVEAINSGSSEPLNNHLADDFSIAGHEGLTATMILKQLFSQLNESVKSHEEISVLKTDQGLKFQFDIDYEKMGTKQATFTFNEASQLKGLELFKMEVKTMEQETEIEKPNDDLISIPFKMAGKLITVEAELNGEKRTFILDTGASRIILNAKHLSLKDSAKTKISSAKGAGGSISGLDITEVEHLNFAGIELRNQEVLTLDLSHLEEELGITFYGLIGFEVVKEFDLIFDYEDQAITLVKPSAFEQYKTDNWKDMKIGRVPFELEGHLPVIQAEVGDQHLRFAIDSGGEGNLIDEKHFPALVELMDNQTTDELIGADGLVQKVQKANVKEMKIGSKTFKNQSTSFSDITHLNEGYGLQLDGIIGYEVLSKQKTLISFAREEMLFVE